MAGYPATLGDDRQKKQQGMLDTIAQNQPLRNFTEQPQTVSPVVKSIGDSAAAITNKLTTQATNFARPYEPAKISNIGEIVRQIPQFQFQRNPEYETTRNLLLNEIRKGITTDIPGQRLTADGLAQLTGLLNTLDNSERQQASIASQYITNLAGQAMHGEIANANQLADFNRTAAQRFNTIMDTGRSFVPGMFNVAANTRNMYTRAMQEFTRVPDNLWLDDPQEAQNQQRLKISSWLTASTLTESQANKLLGYIQNTQQLLQTTTDPKLRDQMIKDLIRAGQIYEAYTMQQQFKGLNFEPRFANGGLVGNLASANIPQLAALQQYQSYAQMMMRMGLKPVPFEAFMQSALQRIPQMQPQATPSHMQAMGFAEGGVVGRMLRDPRQVDGKLVIDTNPEAPRDSIPAVIDNMLPAKLDSGEMVLPREVVMFYGVDKLNKLIDKAKQAMSGAR